MTQQAMIDLVNETVEYYKNNPRAVNDQGKCFYKTPEGHQCAAGRLMTDEAIQQLEERGRLSSGISAVLTLFYRKDLFKEPYTTIHGDFLSKLQQLHDGQTFWDEGQLTDSGKNAQERLIKAIKEGKYDK